MMPTCKVIDYFKTQIGNIHILQFLPNDFAPRLGLKFKYSETIVQITSMSLGSKVHYYCDDKKLITKVWSCILQKIDRKEVKIPVNTEINLPEPPL